MRSRSNHVIGSGRGMLFLWSKLAAIPVLRSVVVAVLVMGSASIAQAQIGPHGAIALSCAACHDGSFDTMAADASFDHRSTGFTLDGAHAALDCIDCHRELVFPDTPNQCADCHDDVHNGELGLDCARCHAATTFTIADDFTGFHDTTRMPLRGAHRTASCIDCHGDGMEDGWRGLSAACVDCHYDDYSRTDNPDHLKAGISAECALCHDEQPGFRFIYDHSIAGFDLTGAHVLLECTECHTGGRFQSLPADCWQCHIDDYHATTSPDHGAAGYSQNCEQCHATDAWIPALNVTDHLTWPLEGAHRAADCAVCHVDDVFLGTPRECFACHDDDYAGATLPDHAAIGFPTHCEECHTASAWRPSLFDHEATTFPRTGAHLTLDCTACHTAETGISPPTSCIACHDDDYADAPEHTSLAFPQDCTQCHTTTGFDPSVFEHTAFLIYTGNHRREWTACADCHQTPGAFTEFSCFKCHSPNEHGVPYSSFDCFQCHRSGR